MVDAKDWREMHEWSAQLLKRQTGQGVDDWNVRIKETGIGSRDELMHWLKARNINGYAQQLLIMERFGYPDFLLKTAEELVDDQFAGREHLRPVFNEVIEAGVGIAQEGLVEVQARKTFVTLRTRRRKFAMVKPTTKTRVDLGLRIVELSSGHLRFAERLQSAKLLRDDTMTHRIPLSRLEDVDDEVSYWLAVAYEQNT
ncbi:hypothetical protein JOF56_005982 [Kibdelosporangium banguiense]|uniref:DUF5655 domain-containing protein n=1 Tax=Kibdelosporangium banguiense TaxID=1365924 RepID=A0ABS4TMF7_9PSEU|nr:DUF5655 domain-containing protein [Kibdelosporangium banguiense]MBP2325597.1 hypothetical protein [Kibdelosporangium banguiense]